jgi:hypothetical protein
MEFILSCDAFSFTFNNAVDSDVVEDYDDDNCYTLGAAVVVAAVVVLAVMI